MKRRGYKIFSIFLSIILCVVSVALIVQLYLLQALTMNLFIPISLIILLLMIIFILLMNVICVRAISRIIISVVVVAITCVYGYGNMLLFTVSGTLNNVTRIQDQVKSTVSVISLASENLSKVSDLEGKTIANLRTIDQEGTKQMNQALKKENIDYQQDIYDNVPAMVQALYEGKVDAIVLNESYRSNVLDLDGYSTFSSDTNVVYSCEYMTSEKNPSLAVSDLTTEPFTVLISGIDTYGSLDEVSRSDVNMLVTINPLTSTILMTSFPRDYFVREVCDDGYCNYGVQDKLTHTGIYGIDTTKDTLENLLDIEINYTFKVNFSSMTDIIDALGGIDIVVDKGMAVSKFYTDSTLEGVKEGKNHLNGERALAYARERKAYLDGDRQRARNQQQVLEAIVQKATSPAIIKNAFSLLNALSDAFQTNLSMNEIKSFIQYEVQALPKWNFEQFVLSGYNDMAVSPEIGTEVAVMYPDENSVSIAHDKIEAVLNGKSSEIIEAPEDEPAGTLSEEEIEAQIQYGLMYETSE